MEDTDARHDKRDIVDDIMRYEDGDMDFDETVEFFQYLIDTGLAWELQGHYGRVAEEAIECGVCHA